MSESTTRLEMTKEQAQTFTELANLRTKTMREMVSVLLDSYLKYGCLDLVKCKECEHYFVKPAWNASELVKGYCANCVGRVRRYARQMEMKKR